MELASDDAGIAKGDDTRVRAMAEKSIRAAALAMLVKRPTRKETSRAMATAE